MSRFRGAVSGAIALTSCLSATAARAQGLTTQFGLSVGRSVPTGDFSGTSSGGGFGGGWAGMALVALKAPSWPVGLRVDAGYMANGASDQLKSDLAVQFGQPADETAKLLSATADLTYTVSPRSRAQPYVLGGVGVYHITIALTEAGTTTNTSATRLAWNLGGGVAYTLGATALFLELRYVDVAPFSHFPRTTFLPLALGVRFGHGSGT